MRAIFYDGLPWKKNPTRVFAFYGVPARKGADRLPAMVLVHGGDGTAFADWVKLWNDRGYAAIAMDTCGSVPSKGYGEPGGADNRPRHNFSGPPGWNASFRTGRLARRGPMDVSRRSGHPAGKLFASVISRNRS
jgi:hypothetical protein